MRPSSSTPSLTCIAARAEQGHTRGRHDKARCRLKGLEAKSSVVVSRTIVVLSFGGSLGESIYMSMVYYHWGSRSSETACATSSASGLGGGTLVCWQYDREREAAAGAAALVPRQWTPPPDVADNNNMTTSKDMRTTNGSFYPTTSAVMVSKKIEVGHIFFRRPLVGF